MWKDGKDTEADKTGEMLRKRVVRRKAIRKGYKVAKGVVNEKKNGRWVRVANQVA